MPAQALGSSISDHFAAQAPLIRPAEAAFSSTARESQYDEELESTEHGRAVRGIGVALLFEGAVALGIYTAWILFHSAAH
jgi:hypothetical protein